MSIRDYLSIIAGGLAIIIALIIILLSFKAKYRSRILTLRITSVILITLGLLAMCELFD